jgi:hypothetical protein
MISWIKKLIRRWQRRRLLAKMRKNDPFIY